MSWSLNNINLCEWQISCKISSNFSELKSATQNLLSLLTSSANKFPAKWGNEVVNLCSTISFESFYYLMKLIYTNPQHLHGVKRNTNYYAARLIDSRLLNHLTNDPTRSNRRELKCHRNRFWLDYKTVVWSAEQQIRQNGWREMKAKWMKMKKFVFHEWRKYIKMSIVRPLQWPPISGFVVSTVTPHHNHDSDFTASH